MRAGFGIAINNADANHEVITGWGIFDATGYKMFRASPDGVQVLPIMAGDLATQPNAIDDDGNLVGMSVRADRTLAAISYTDALGMVLLNQLVPASSDWDVDPIAGGDYLISGNGTNGAQIVGTGLTGGGLTRGFVMTSDTTNIPASTVMTKIGMLPKFPDDWNRTVSPRGINHSGEVVGVITDYSGIHDLNAFVWTENTGIIDLNDYIDPNSGWNLAGAYAINDNHEVVGMGWINGVPRVTGQERAFKIKLPELCPETACHGPGLKDPLTGVCSVGAQLPDGTTCNDNNACTSGDHCSAGACVPQTQVTCPGDSCRPAGTCDTTTGLCSVEPALPDGAPCDDGNQCTTQETCQAGSCVPESPVTGCTDPHGPYYAPLVNLGSTQGASAAWGINDNHEVIGADTTSSSLTWTGVGAAPVVGFHWTQAGGSIQIPRSVGRAIFPRGVNNAGVIVGTAVDAGTANIGRVFRFDPTVDAAPQFVQIPTGIGTAINTAGQITGHGVFPAGHWMFRATGGDVLSIPGIPATTKSRTPSMKMAISLVTPFDQAGAPPPFVTRMRYPSSS